MGNGKNTQTRQVMARWGKQAKRPRHEGRNSQVALKGSRTLSKTTEIFETAIPTS
jgi:hypothetical protein